MGAGASEVPVAAARWVVSTGPRRLREVDDATRVVFSSSFFFLVVDAVRVEDVVLVLRAVGAAFGVARAGWRVCVGATEVCFIAVLVVGAGAAHPETKTADRRAAEIAERDLNDLVIAKVL